MYIPPPAPIREAPRVPLCENRSFSLFLCSRSISFLRVFISGPQILCVCCGVCAPRVAPDRVPVLTAATSSVKLRRFDRLFSATFPFFGNLWPLCSRLGPLLDSFRVFIARSLEMVATLRPFGWFFFGKIRVSVLFQRFGHGSLGIGCADVLSV